MLRNKIGPSFDAKNVFFFLFGSLFLKISFSLQKKEDFWKTKKEKQRKLGPSFDSKRLFWTKFWLYSIYVYAGELLVCPPFGLQRVISLAPLRVISLSTFLGAISHYTNRAFWGFWGWFLVQISVFWVSCFLLISHLFFDLLHLSNFPKPLFLKRQFLKKMQKVCFKKHYKNRGFWRVSIFQRSKNNCLLIANFENPKIAFLATNSVWKGLKPLFFCRKQGFQKWPLLCRFFGGKP